MYKKILFLSNHNDYFNNCLFSLKAYENYLIPLAKSLSKNSNLELKIICSGLIFKNISKTLISSLNSQIKFSLFNENKNSFYNEIFEFKPEPVNLLHNNWSKAFIDDWKPEIIICWESNSQNLRRLYPDSLVLDVTPGMFSKAPYPEMLSIDPMGILSKCWYSNTSLSSIPLDSIYSKDFNRIKSFFNDQFKDLYPSQFLDLNKSNGYHKILLPLQISNYFTWKESSNYIDQVDFLEDVLSIFSKCNITVTQYNGFISERILSNEFLAELSKKYRTFNYFREFDTLTNISQYFINDTDTTISISSNVGLLAKYWGKRLISPSNSHLRYIADSNILDAYTIDSEIINLDNFFISFLGRTQFIKSRLIDKRDYFENLISSFYLRMSNSGIELFPETNLVENTFEQIEKYSNKNLNIRKFKNFSSSMLRPCSDYSVLKKNFSYIEDSKYKYISFDLFDTLVCRPFSKPRDLFYLVKLELMTNYSNLIDAKIIENFESLRIESENLLKKKLLNHDNKCNREELSLYDIYQNIFEMVGSNISIPIKTLVEIECEVEFKNISPKLLGKKLFDYASSLSKEVIIVSDSYFSLEFLSSLLKKCGYFGYSKLYVSSEIGLKKDSGNLFQYVLGDIKSNPENIIHIGDNPKGDILMPSKFGIKSLILENHSSQIKSILIKRGFNPGYFENSFFIMALVGYYNNVFAKFDSYSNYRKKRDPYIFSNTFEFGFLLLGPLAYGFSSWILDEAQNTCSKQIIFFARDSILPYKILKRILKNSNDQISSIKLVYIPISRAAISGINILEPSDIFKIVISDYRKTDKVVNLLKDRFLLENEDISVRALNLVKHKSLLNLEVQDLSFHDIYRIALYSYEDNWSTLSTRVMGKRNDICMFLKSLGVDFSIKTIAVDFGYRGTIYNSIKGFFENSFLPRFFIGYSSFFGVPNLEGLKSYYSDDILLEKNNEGKVLLKYTLILETLFNEPVDSIKGVYFENNEFSLDRYYSSNGEHKRIIKEIHDGVIKFSDYYSEFSKSYPLLKITPEISSALLGFVLKNPTYTESKVLNGLEFDNDFSGHEIRSIYHENSARRNSNSPIWIEGYKEVNAYNNNLAIIMKSLSPARLVVFISLSIIKIYVKIFFRKKYDKFNKDPYLFCLDSKYIFIRFIGNSLIKTKRYE